MKKKTENRFLNVFDNMVETIIKDSRVLPEVVSTSINKTCEESLSISEILGAKLPGDYAIDEKTRGAKIDKKCLICDENIENIFELSYRGIIIGPTTPVWEKTKSRCKQCHILYDY